MNNSRMEKSEIEMLSKRKVNIAGKNGIRLSLYTGYLEHGFADRWSTLHFYHAYAGDVLKLVNVKGGLLQDVEGDTGEKYLLYEFAVATYSLEWEDQYMYTYCYEKEENWSTYNHDLTPESYRQDDYVFQRECYFRVNCRRVDGGILTVEDEYAIVESLAFFSAQKKIELKECFQTEIQDTVEKIALEKGKKFMLLTDTHYVVNGTWEDTLSNMQAVASSCDLDGVIHLGDITDGMVSREVNIEYIGRVLNGMKKLGLPMDFTLGNHDSNYFRNNPEKFTEEEQYDYYLQTLHPNRPQLYYYKDHDDIKVRFIFLHSFDYREEVRYGFSDAEVEWFSQVLDGVPEGYRALVFSHVPPLPVIHFWSDKIRNGEKMVELLETHMAMSGCKVLGWIHGHNHADAVYRGRQFPIIAIGCNKYEYFLDKKPEGSFTPARKVNDASQDLWDVLCIEKDSDALKFIRFGAGEDRVVE